MQPPLVNAGFYDCDPRNAAFHSPAGASERRIGAMRKPDPKATEFQQFGLTGIVFGTAAVIGLLSAVLKTIGWL
jgi:hypothetical protein